MTTLSILLLEDLVDLRFDGIGAGDDRLRVADDHDAQDPAVERPGHLARRDRLGGAAIAGEGLRPKSSLAGPPWIAVGVLDDGGTAPSYSVERSSLTASSTCVRWPPASFELPVFICAS